MGSSGQLRHSQGYLTVGMLHAEGFPCLTIKAWNGRLFLIFLDICLSSQIDTLKQAGQQPGVELLHASLVTRCLCSWFDKVERCGRYLDPQDANDIMNIGKTFLMVYQKLAWASVIEKTVDGNFYRSFTFFATYVRTCTCPTIIVDTIIAIAMKI